MSEQGAGYWAIAWRFFVIAAFATAISVVSFAIGQRGTYQTGFENGARVGYAQGRQHCAAPQRFHSFENSSVRHRDSATQSLFLGSVESEHKPR